MGYCHEPMTERGPRTHRGSLVKRIECQGESIVTTDDVAHAVATFSAAAHRRGRVVKVEVPVVDDARQHVAFILSPGEPLTVRDCATRPADIDGESLIRSLGLRQSAWLARASAARE